MNTPAAPLSSEERRRTIEAMDRLGGSFVKALAEAWLRADADNSARIEAAFPEYIATYRAIAARDAGRAA